MLRGPRVACTATPRYSSLRRSSIASDVRRTRLGRARRVTGRRATATRSRPARSGRISTASVPGAGEQARRPPAPWSAPISSTSQPPGRIHRGAPATISADGVEPVGAGEQRAVRLPRRGRPARRRASRRRRTAGWRRRGRARVPAGRASNHDPAAMRTLRAAAADAGEVGPGDVEGVGATSVSHTVTPSTGSSSASASPIAPEPVPRSATVSGRGSVAGQLDGDAGDDLGLRPRDQHPAVDGQVEVAEAPAAEHVRQRLAGRDGGRAWRRGGRPCAAVAGSSSTSSSSPVGAARHLAQPAGRRPLADRSPASRRAARATSRRVVAHVVVGELAGPLVGGEGGDDVVEVAGEHVGEPVDREPDAVVGEPVLLEVVGADLLAPPAAADLRRAARPTARRRARARPARAAGRAAPASPASRFCSWLRSSCIDTTMPRRQVGDAHGRVGGVDALAARTARPEDVDLQVLVVDLRPRPRRPRAARAPSPTTCGCGPGSR